MLDVSLLEVVFWNRALCSKGFDSRPTTDLVLFNFEMGVSRVLEFPEFAKMLFGDFEVWGGRVEGFSRGVKFPFFIAKILDQLLVWGTV